jgi:hypothetical protein
MAVGPATFSHLLVHVVLPEVSGYRSSALPAIGVTLHAHPGWRCSQQDRDGLLVGYSLRARRFIFAETHDTSRLDQLANGGLDGSLGARRRAELHASIVEVKIDRSLRQSERLGYLP